MTISKWKKVDVTPYKCIVFDEILLYNPVKLYSIKVFMAENAVKDISAQET